MISTFGWNTDAPKEGGRDVAALRRSKGRGPRQRGRARKRRVWDGGLGNKRRTLEFLYGICTDCLLDPASLAAPREAITSPNALRLLLMAWVSRNRSLSFAAPEDDSLSEPARSYRDRADPHGYAISV